MVLKPGHAIKFTIASVDWGFTNPGVILVWAIDADGRMYCVRQVYQTKRLIDWWVEQAKAIQLELKPIVYVCDPAEPAYIRAFQQAGLRAIAANNAIAPGVQAVQKRLQVAEDGNPRLFILRGSLTDIDEDLRESGKPTRLEDEISGYVWAKGANGKPLKELPVDVDNHALDAMRYAVMYVDQPRARSRPNDLYD